MQKVFSLIYNFHPLYRKCLEMRQIPEWIDYEIITNRRVTTGDRDFRQDTSIERLAYLQKYPDAWYLDADVIVDKWPDFEMEKGYPYLARLDSNYYDDWAILGNGCQWFFDLLMERMGDDPKPLWAHRIINTELRSKIRPIPKGYFRHLMLSSFVKRCEENPGRAIRGTDFSVTYKKEDWVLEIKEK
jgi:hypothetical protein